VRKPIVFIEFAFRCQTERQHSIAEIDPRRRGDRHKKTWPSANQPTIRASPIWGRAVPCSLPVRRPPFPHRSAGWPVAAHVTITRHPSSVQFRRDRNASQTYQHIRRARATTRRSIRDRVRKRNWQARRINAITTCPVAWRHSSSASPIWWRMNSWNAALATGMS